MLSGKKRKPESTVFSPASVISFQIRDNKTVLSRSDGWNLVRIMKNNRYMFVELILDLPPIVVFRIRFPVCINYKTDINVFEASLVNLKLYSSGSGAK